MRKELLPAADSLSIIIPFRQSSDRPEAAWRLHYLLRYIRRTLPQAEVLVSDQTSRLPLGAALAHLHDAHYVWRPASIYSPATCKNAGAIAAKRDYLLFLDIDVFPLSDLYKSVAQFIERGGDFLWFPIHFLGEGEGSYRRVFLKAVSPSHKWSDIDQVGYATGIQAFSKEFFMRVGGYDEIFKGYGCEDIEMLHRCSLHLGWLRPYDIDETYLEDYRTKNREDYRGFRKVFAQIVEDILDTSRIYGLHVWHNRRAKRRYRRMRISNDRVLVSRLRERG